MNIKIPTFIFAISLFSLQAIAQQSYKNEPLIFANSERAAVGIGKNWTENRWRISPQIAHDTLNITSYSGGESVAFRTDRDSIRFNIKIGETKSFYVKMGNAEPAHTIISVQKFLWNKVVYGKTAKQKDLKLFYEKANALFFDTLRKHYPLVQAIKNDHSDMQKVLSILNWTHHQWKHDGGNAPKGNNGLLILDEAKAGGRFPCFAYAIVLRDQLIAQGFAARVLYLKTKDAETRKGSPGHVATEVYLKDLGKWVFVDGQFNVMPTLKGKPLNAAEFQNALSTNYENVVLASRDIVSKKEYTDFVYDYLYYLDFQIDGRLTAANKRTTYKGKSNLMLVPVGAPNLTKMDFWKSTVDYCSYTNSINDFYAKPF